MENEPLQPTGVDPATGDYLFSALDPSRDLPALGEEISAPHQAKLRWRYDMDRRQHLAVVDGVEPADLAQAGWGVIFPQGVDEAVRQALEPLIAHRRIQAGKLFKVLEQDRGESMIEFLARHGTGPGRVDPRHLPYYLLIVGDPGEIPFEFQYQLGLQHAVGRLHFDHSEEYARYAESVVRAEGGVVRPRKAALFGVAKDRVTRAIRDHLILRLKTALTARYQPPWNIFEIVGKDATKSRLMRLLQGDEQPALLFAAGHGLGYARDDSRLRDEQGAFLCQEWPGPGSGPVDRRCYLSAADVTEDARVHGLIAFLFACFGAGTPAHNSFAHRDPSEPASYGRRPFVARLPQRLLSHPDGGALAVIGHVDRLWGYSFYWPIAGPQLQPFVDTLRRLLQGFPVGLAMEPFSQRYAELGCVVAGMPPPVAKAGRTKLLQSAGLRTAYYDARNYVILGDPAVRLAQPM